MLYIRRNRPIMMVDENLLPQSLDGSRTTVPREFEFDMIKQRSHDLNKNMIYRDNPKIETQAFMDSISSLMLSIYQKVQMSYASVNDSGIGANASGDSITKREKSTTIMRDSKIKLWIPYVEQKPYVVFYLKGSNGHKNI